MKSPGSSINVSLGDRTVVGTVIRYESRGFDLNGKLNLGYWVSIPSYSSEWGTAVIWVDAS